MPNVVHRPQSSLDIEQFAHRLPDVTLGLDPSAELLTADKPVASR
jgi:hypothetical protein